MRSPTPASAKKFKSFSTVGWALHRIEGTPIDVLMPTNNIKSRTVDIIQNAYY